MDENSEDGFESESEGESEGKSDSESESENNDGDNDDSFGTFEHEDLESLRRARRHMRSNASRLCQRLAAVADYLPRGVHVQAIDPMTHSGKSVITLVGDAGVPLDLAEIRRALSNVGVPESVSFYGQTVRAVLSRSSWFTDHFGLTRCLSLLVNLTMIIYCGWLILQSATATTTVT